MFTEDKLTVSILSALACEVSGEKTRQCTQVCLVKMKKKSA
jgi:hypothetical protein